MIKFFKKNRKIILDGIMCLGLFLILWQSGLVLAQEVKTNILPAESTNTGGTFGQNIAELLSGITMVFVSVVGKLFTALIDVLLGVATFDQFVDSRAVLIGWTVIRDLTNMFFVAAILIIAFGTLFNVQTYEYKKTLPKLIIAIVLVNFSKSIVGFFIDIGQVVMLQFVYAFKDIAAGAVIEGLGIQTMFEIADTIEDITGDDINYWSIFGATVLALVMMVIASVVVLSLIVILLFRILMLWVLLIFSPVAFLSSALPSNPLEKVGMFGQYWGQLSKYIIVGPILAFFLWLSFSIISSTNTKNSEHVIALHREIAAQGAKNAATESQYVQYLASKVSSPQGMFDYMVVIALLIGSLMAAQQMGVMGGAMGMNAVNKMKGMAQKWGTKAAKGMALGAGRKLDKWSISAQAAMGKKRPISLRPSIIKEAYKSAKQRKEERFYGEKGVKGGMEDIFNRAMTWGKDKSNKQHEEKMSMVSKNKREIEEMPGGDNEDYLVKRYKTATSMSEKEGIAYSLAKIHGINNLAPGGKGADVANLIKTDFGGKEGARIMSNIESLGLNNKDSQWKGRTKFNTETGEFEFDKLDKSDFDKDKNPELAANLSNRLDYYRESRDPDFDNVKSTDDLFQEKNTKAKEKMFEEKAGYEVNRFHSKLSGRAIVQQTTKDALHVDEDGNLDPVAQQMVLASARAQATDYNYGQMENKKHMGDSKSGFVEALKKFADTDSRVDETKKKEIYQWIGQIIDPQKKANTLFEGDGAIINEDKANSKINEWKKGGVSDSSQRDKESIINHKQEAQRKQEKIAGNNEKINKAKEEKDQAEKRSKDSKTIYAEKKEQETVVSEKTKEIDNLEKENQALAGDIKNVHEPIAKNEDAANNFDPQNMNEGEKINLNQLSQALSQAMKEAMSSMETGGKIDFSKLEIILKNFGSQVNKNIKSDPKLDLSYGQKTNMDKVADMDNKKRILSSLKKIADIMSEKSEGE